MQLSEMPEGWLRTAAAPEPTLVWLDTCGLPAARDSKQQSSYVNRVEVGVCEHVVRTLLSLGVRPQDIGVTSPYSQQVRRLQQAISASHAPDDNQHPASDGPRQEKGSIANPQTEAAQQSDRSCAEVAVMTIDQFQGQDKAAMVVSLVRSNTGKQTGDLLKDARRINVALTRAKHKIVIIGDSCTVTEVPLLGRVFNGVQRLGIVVRLNQDDILNSGKRLSEDTATH
jgi:DNA replication ATP-dependent helicase Dna2